MGSGIYSELQHIPKISDSPWLFRMTPDGELLWEHVYYELDSSFQNMSSRVGAIFDFVELNNGDVIAVGNFNYSDSDMLIMRVDSNGCLTPGDCNTINFITANQEINPNLDQILLYPNPISSTVFLHSPTNSQYQKFSIFDINSIQLYSGILSQGQNEINVSQLGSGMYILQLLSKEGKITFKKFLKM
jgi:hypothetical protein